MYIYIYMCIPIALTICYNIVYHFISVITIINNQSYCKK